MSLAMSRVKASPAGQWARLVHRPNGQAGLLRPALSPSAVRQRGDEVTPPREPLRLPPNFRDVTAEKIGTVIGIVGATAAKATKPG